MTHDPQQMNAGPELDLVISQFMESKPLPVSARALRALQASWQWNSSHVVYSPGGWWQAEIGTDHGPSSADDEPVRWTPSRAPSTDHDAAFEVVDRMESFEIGSQAGHPLKLQRIWWRDEWEAQLGMTRATAKTVPLAICRAAAKVIA